MKVTLEEIAKIEAEANAINLRLADARNVYQSQCPHPITALVLIPSNHYPIVYGPENVMRNITISCTKCGFTTLRKVFFKH